MKNTEYMELLAKLNEVATKFNVPIITARQHPRIPGTRAINIKEYIRQHKEEFEKLGWEVPDSDLLNDIIVLDHISNVGQ